MLVASTVAVFAAGRAAEGVDTHAAFVCAITVGLTGCGGDEDTVLIFAHFVFCAVSVSSAGAGNFTISVETNVGAGAVTVGVAEVFFIFTESAVADLIVWAVARSVARAFS